MRPLAKLLKPSFLHGFLLDGLTAAGAGFSAAVFDAEDTPIAWAGVDVSKATPHDEIARHLAESPGQATRELLFGGTQVGRLLVSGPGRAEQAQGLCRFLALSLNQLLDQHQLRRSLGEEALEQYREMALINRSVLHLNRSMRVSEVADALLSECESGLGPGFRGLMYFRDEKSDGFTCYGSQGPVDQGGYKFLPGCPLFIEVMAQGRGEIINDLAHDERWNKEVQGIESVLIKPIVVSGEVLGALVLAGIDHGSSFSTAHLKRMDTLATVAGIAMANAMHFEQTGKILLALIKAMSTAIDSRDTTTSGHSQRVAQLAFGLAQAVNNDTKIFPDKEFSAIQLQELYYAGLLHDVGKIGVREEVLTKSTRLPKGRLDLIGLKLAFWGTANNVSWQDELSRFKKINESYMLTDEDKAVIDRFHSMTLSASGRSLPVLSEEERAGLITDRGNLTEEEWIEIFRHPIESCRILQHIPLSGSFPDFMTIIRQHHERLDGSGYPEGMKGDDILFQSQILAIVDMYDALRQKRHYKAPKTQGEALAIIDEDAGAGRLDMGLVSLFRRDIKSIETAPVPEDVSLANLEMF
ncbi:MAG: GAF domain-containing protein [Desulfovibrio sp.]|nr:MAG: GAF domain-containing protein [Desulfovibrio sp.]